MVSVNTAIQYIESCGYRLTCRTRGLYVFRDNRRPVEFRVMSFSLAELRDIYRKGW